MSLSQSLFSAISGLKNHQRAMDNIGNNLANVNTVGFKKGVFQFRTLMEQTLQGGSQTDPNTGRGAINPLQIGLGTTTGSIMKDFQNGGVEITGNQRDMAIEGNGFFVLRSGNSNVFSRDGTFYLGSDGSLLAGSGLSVQGVMADETGRIPPSGSVTDIVIPIGQTGAAVETTKVSMTGNLDSNYEVATGLRLAANSSIINDPADPNYDFDLARYFGEVNQAHFGGATGDSTWTALTGNQHLNGGTVTTTAALGVPVPGNPNQTMPATVTGNNTSNLADLRYLSGTTWVQPFDGIDQPGASKEITVSFRKGGRLHTETFHYEEPPLAYSSSIADFMQFLTGNVDRAGDASSVNGVQSIANRNLTGGVMGTIQVEGNVSRTLNGTSAYNVPMETAGAFSRHGVSNQVDYDQMWESSAGIAPLTTWNFGAPGFQAVAAIPDSMTVTVGGAPGAEILQVENPAGTIVAVSGAFNSANPQNVTFTTTPAGQARAAALGLPAAQQATAFNGGVFVSGPVAPLDTGTVTLNNIGLGPSANFSIVSNLGEDNAITNVVISYNNVTYTDMFQQDSQYSDVQGGAATTNMVVYDSLGNPKEVTMQMVLVDRDSNFSTWRWVADSKDCTNADWLLSPPQQPPATPREIISDLNVGTGVIRFDSQGRFVKGAELSESLGIGITLENQGVKDQIRINLTPGLSASANQDLNFNDLTQVRAQSDFNLKEQDGSAPGTLDSFTTSPDGVIQGVFSNGVVQALGRLSLAIVPNMNGMMSMGNNLFLTGPASGAAQIGFAGVGGRGSVRSGAIESSNVDLSEEFTKLITIERGFQANSRVISTSDNMLQELVNLKR